MTIQNGKDDPSVVFSVLGENAYDLVVMVD